METCDRPIPSQPLRSPHPVPHGNFGFRPPVAPPRRLDGVIRPTRCLPPGPCPSGLSEVSQVLHGSRRFSVQGSLLWSFLGASGLHLGHGSILLIYAPLRLQDPSLLRRLATSGILVSGDYTGEGLSPMVMRSFGYSDKSFEEYPPSFSMPGLSRHDSPVISFTGFSIAGSRAQGFISRRGIRIFKAAAAKALALSSRRHVLSLGGGSGFLPPYAGSTTSPACGGLWSPGLRSRFLGRFLPPGSSVVVRRCTPRGRGSSGPFSARSRPVHRRLGCILGCVSRFRSTFGLVVSELLPIFDQPLRTSDCLSCSPWLPTSASAPLGGSLPGQRHCVSISSEGGGHEIVHPQYSGSRFSVSARSTPSVSSRSLFRVV